MRQKTPWWRNDAAASQQARDQFDESETISWSQSDLPPLAAGDRVTLRRTDWFPMPASAKLDTHTFIIGDIRGNAPMLLAALKAIKNTDGEADRREIIFNGELIGVMPRSCETMDILRDVGSSAGVDDFTILRPSLCDTINHMYSPLRGTKDAPDRPRNAFDRKSSGFAAMLESEFGPPDTEEALYDPAGLPQTATQFLKGYAKTLSGMPRMVLRGTVSILGPSSIPYADQRHLGYPAHHVANPMMPPDFKTPAPLNSSTPYMIDPFDPGQIVVFGGSPVLGDITPCDIALKRMNMLARHKSIATDIGCGSINQLAWVEIVDFRFRLAMVQDARESSRLAKLVDELIGDV